MTDFNPDEQTLFTVVHGTSSAIPAFREACLAGACPTPAERTFPSITSFTADAGSFALSNADLMAIEPEHNKYTLKVPSSGPVKDANLPLILPIGVRAADTITTSCEWNKILFEQK